MFYFKSLIQLCMCAGYPAWPMTGDQSGTDEIFMAAQEAVGAATGQQRDSQGRHEWLTLFIIIMVHIYNGFSSNKFELLI